MSEGSGAATQDGGALERHREAMRAMKRATHWRKSSTLALEAGRLCAHASGMPYREAAQRVREWLAPLEHGFDLRAVLLRAYLDTPRLGRPNFEQMMAELAADVEFVGPLG